MSSTPETVLSVVHQHACCCGAMLLESGEWGQLAGVQHRIVSFTTFDPALNETTVHQVSHGYCPTCLREARQELVEIQSRRVMEAFRDG